MHQASTQNKTLISEHCNIVNVKHDVPDTEKTTTVEVNTFIFARVEYFHGHPVFEKNEIPYNIRDE